MVCYTLVGCANRSGRNTTQRRLFPDVFSCVFASGEGLKGGTTWIHDFSYAVGTEREEEKNKIKKMSSVPNAIRPHTHSLTSTSETESVHETLVSSFALPCTTEKKHIWSNKIEQAIEN